MFSKAALYEKVNIDLPASQHYDMTKLNPKQMYIYSPQTIPEYSSTPMIPRTNILHSCNLKLTRHGESGKIDNI